MRTKRRKKQPERRTGMLLGVIKAALLGCVVTIIAILLFALLLKIELVGEGAIPVATSIIKALCAAFAGLLAARSAQGRGWVWGGIGGAAYVLLAFAAFSLVEKTMAFTLGLLADMLMGFVAGIAGSLVLQLKKSASG